MKVYLYFMYSAYYFFKKKNYNDPKWYASMLSIFVIFLLCVSLILSIKNLFSLPNVSIISVMPITFLVEKKLYNYFSKNFQKQNDSFEYIKSNVLFRSIIIVGYYVFAFLLIFFVAR